MVKAPSPVLDARRALVVALLNVLMRLGLESEADREREEQARRFFDRHGRWR